MQKGQSNNKLIRTSLFSNQEDLYRSLIEDSKDGFYASDTNGRIIFANQGLAKILGYSSADELIGKDFFSAIPGEKLQKLKRKLKRAIKEQANGLPIRTRVYKKDGVIATLEIKPVFVYNGSVLLGTRGIVLDITQRMDMEKKLMEKEKRFSALFENANAAIFTMDGEVFTSCNHMTVSMFSCTNKMDIIGHFPWEFSPPFQPDGKDSGKMAKEKIQAALNGEPQRFYWKHCTKAKVPFDAEVMLNAIEINDQVMIQAIVNDISTRKKAEEDLRKSEEQFRSLFENATIGIYKTSPNGEIIMANSAAVNMLGCSSLEELKQRDLKREGFGPRYSRQQFVTQIERDGEIKGIETVWKKKDGTDVFIRESAKVIKDDAGESLYYEGTVEDVTARKLAEDLLIESEGRLRQLNATKDKFFSIIAHDLKTPFNSIVGFSNLLLEDAEKNSQEDILKYAHIIMKSSERAMGLLTNLLDWARSQTGRMVFNPSRFNIIEVIQGVLHLFYDALTAKSLIVNLEMPDYLLVCADKAMIETVMRNLISNAIKFTQNNGEIDISARLVNEEILVSIGDTGVGMDEKTIDKLFKIEESYSTSGTNNESGTGLGLILCDEFIQKHQGKIWVKSTKGHGSVFYFTIPYKC